MITENLSTLKIHKLTQEQYDRELEAGRVDPSALYLTPDDGGKIEILHVDIDFSEMTCSHSASEIDEAVDTGMFPIINRDPTMILYSIYGNPRIVVFSGSFIDEYGGACHSVILIHDDKSVEEFVTNNISTIHVVTVDENNIASHNSLEIDDIVWYNNNANVVKVLYNGYAYDYKYYEYNGDTGVLIAYFDFSASDANGKFTSVISIDNDGHVEEIINVEEPIVPIPEESDVGKVLVAGSDNQVYWENASGKTLTEHLAEEDMILSSRQFGDELPPAGIPGRIFFKRVSE